jgi:hypothetical protein
LPGTNGTNGTNGAAGAKGDIGLSGTNGTDGAVGAKGDIGLSGAAGTNGVDGATGSDGLPGAHAVDGTVVGQTLIWNGTVWTPTASSCTPYHYGDTGPDGGKVFYVDGSGCHGLEAQAADASSGAAMTWTTAISTSAAYNDSSNLITGAAGFNCSTTDAQLTPYCWHLPSKTELEYLFEQKDVVGGFANDNYWSSLENDSNNAWSQNFGNGNQVSTVGKLGSIPVRAVRAF